MQKSVDKAAYSHQLWYLKDNNNDDHFSAFNINVQKLLPMNFEHVFFFGKTLHGKDYADLTRFL